MWVVEVVAIKDFNEGLEILERYFCAIRTRIVINGVLSLEDIIL